MSDMPKRVPLWRQIQQDLSGQIENRHLRVGEKLPTEAQLAKQYGVNRHTVRRALAAMSDAGLVRSQQGSGVYVSVQPIDVPLSHKCQVAARSEAAGHILSHFQMTLEKRAPTHDETHLFGMTKEEPVLVTTGRATLDGDSFFWAECAIPEARHPEITRYLRQGSTIHEAVAKSDDPNLQVSAAQIIATGADDWRAQALDVRKGTAIQLMRVILSDGGSHPLALINTWYLADRISFTATMNREGRLIVSDWPARSYAPAQPLAI